MIKLIASDMDGTILKDHLTLHPDNVKAVKEVLAQGMHFVICTGRDYNQARLCLEPHGIDCPIIGHNGAVTYGPDGTIWDQHPMDLESAAQIAQYIQDQGLDWQMMTSEGIFALHYLDKLEVRMAQIKEKYGHLSPSEFEIHASKLSRLFFAHQAQGVEEVVSRPNIQVYKITSEDPQGLHDLSLIRNWIQDHYPHLVVTSSFKDNLEINHQEAQKGLALASYAAGLGISMDQVFAVGDNGNDRSMLEKAGYSVAMGNAPQEIKAIAKYTTTTNLEGGVAKAIWQCLASQEG